MTPLFGSITPLRIPTKTRFISSDADVNTYILAVEAADGQELEAGVITSIETFVTGCKSDGIWSALKSSCILAGARSLNGALVPLVGSATNNNFVSGDYNRETGLKGDGSTKFLNANRNNNADPQNSKHISIYISELHTGTASQYFIASGDSGAGHNAILFGSAAYRFASPNGSGLVSGVAASTGFKGVSRNNSANFDRRNASATLQVTDPSRTPLSASFNIYKRNSGNFANNRMAFYSIGESLDLAKLDARVSTLMTDLTAAIV